MKVEATPAPLVEDSPRYESGNCESFRPLVSKYNWDVNIALAVMHAESGCRTNAVNINTNGTNDAGLFQINSIHSDLISDEARFDPEQNVSAAYAIYRGSGWSAWAAYNSGSYQKYI